MKNYTLNIPKKKGPFSLKKLSLASVLEIMSGYDVMSQENKILSLVQASLVDDAGELVYSKKQFAKMEKELGGVKLLQLSMDAQAYNDFGDFQDFGDKVEDAEKN
jgi:hypothetical protein